ncbi:Formylglycine-generating enzyme, required for sulfatase activity, contains SUMF1/FGE domain [Alkalispirochaeta americana]|uniref:Formylglycine-generating enzyme, required for sulfatase activity, contains SUMF1/FGE domain n=1 Tax=Alkalispirochaeta americana TaxID=159291 RepID=A0A1N6Q8B2_9SPIO|nr:SUMF1/EgtB/PvdO family nonheme iron enzyme [Alkalispirochaeta americana]SIQ12752.1 Formylglycine-generating enzyme, required for sulfatase activity, contains SUMF1/FGE domain [Alkalispirochaeta americana]
MTALLAGAVLLLGACATAPEAPEEPPSEAQLARVAHESYPSWVDTPPRDDSPAEKSYFFGLGSGSTRAAAEERASRDIGLQVSRAIRAHLSLQTRDPHRFFLDIAEHFQSPHLYTTEIREHHQDSAGNHWVLAAARTDGLLDVAEAVLRSYRRPFGLSHQGINRAVSGLEETLIHRDQWVLAAEQPWISPLGFSFREVPAGTFLRDETPSGEIHIERSFLIGTVPVTQDQFSLIMGVNPSHFADAPEAGEHPVDQVSWYDAIAFANKLSLAEGRSPLYHVEGVDFETLTYQDIPVDPHEAWDNPTVDWSGDGYRLPTEMEWMWAALGADALNPREVNSQGYRQRFAGEAGAPEDAGGMADYAWFSSTSGRTTRPAGTKLPNQLGLYDMSGNVWEWSYDFWEPLPSAFRTLRGGGWMSLSTNLAVTNRSEGVPHYRYYGYGFRLVKP